MSERSHRICLSPWRAGLGLVSSAGLVLAAGLVWLAGCGGEPEPQEPPGPTLLDPAVVAAIDPTELRESIDFLADDARGGRIPGSPGHLEARDWIAERMEAVGLQPLGTDGYFFDYPNQAVPDRFQLDASGAVVPQQTETGWDLVGLLPGSDPERADEYVVLVAHYDHLGVDAEGRPYNGAFDDAAGVAAALEIARVLHEHEAAPPRSVVVLITDDEEAGLVGSESWLDAPTVPLGDVVGAISIDPVGRPLLPDYWPIVAIGLERSPRLQALWREVAVASELPVVFLNRDIVPVFASDQDEFYVAPVPRPAAWFVNPGFSFYHTVDDTPETIDYRVLLQTTRWLGHVVTAMGSSEDRWAYEGPRPFDGATAADALVLFDGILASGELSHNEVVEASSYRSTLGQAAEANSLDGIDNLDLFLFEAVYFVMFELTTAHPGEIPPPFPE